MEQKITCFITKGEPENIIRTISEIRGCTFVGPIYTMQGEISGMSGIKTINTGRLEETRTLKKMAEITDSPYLLLINSSNTIIPGAFALERFIRTAEETSASMLYSDYFEEKAGNINIHPLIDYQYGSLRDDFNFGPLLFIPTTVFKKAVNLMSEEYLYAGLYDLRLKLSLQGSIFRIEEPLYTLSETQKSINGEKHFDYVNPRNREVQVEMEKACTLFLKEINGWLSPATKHIDITSGTFASEASVIIPVKNREKTIADAIESVLKQKTNFSYNLIIVDNHSTDQTTSIINSFASKHSHIIHLIPEHRDLGIGGCWNMAITDKRCGRFSIQLDSDDLYKNEGVLQKIVDTFYREKAASVIGSYQIVNFNLNEIPPGLIDHKEWTEENGKNNALRINGLGAPRAFYTPILRKIKFPNTSYGEDYAVMLAICRHYRIGRIYESLYLCRRWEDNTDASLPIEKENSNNHFKDKIRTIELLARQQIRHSHEG